MATKVKQRSARAIIRPQEFDRLINIIASDISLRWNPVIERWQVYQVQTSPLVQADGMPKVRGIIMFTIEEDNGDYREPMQMDYDRIVRSIQNLRKLMELGPERYADMLDKRDLAREKKISAKANEKLEYAAHEIADHTWNDRTMTSMRRSR